jgi:tetratricopeptide (TPR) repeat protein
MSEGTVATGERIRTPQPLTSAFPSSLLEQPKPRWHAGLGLAESQLLRAEEEAVPFDAARQPELDALRDWALTDDFKIAVRLVTGRGGTGKTRLALALITSLAGEGWHCGFVPPDLADSQASDLARRLSSRREPQLLVLDYAETRQDTLLSLLRTFLETVAEAPSTRILLLARAGGEWWERLPDRDSRCEGFLTGYATTGPHPLPPLHHTAEERARAYEAAVESYARRLGISDPPHLRIDLSGDHFSYPLFVQMGALLALHGERPATAEGLTKALLHHERRYWRRVVAQLCAEHPTAAISGTHAEEVMTIATLCGSFSSAAEARTVWRSWSAASGTDLSPSHQRIIAEKLASLYSDGRKLEPLKPDLLGEALVTGALLRAGGDDLINMALRGERLPSQRKQALTVVARLSVQRPDVEEVVTTGVANNFASCAADLVAVAAHTDGRLSEWAERAFDALSGPTKSQVIGILAPFFLHETVRLAQLACAVSRADVERAKDKWTRRPADKRRQLDYAMALTNHAIDLLRAGRAALATARDSVAVFQQLTPSERTIGQKQYASALDTYANLLAAEGQYQEALLHCDIALRLRERLAKAEPRGVTSDVARSLSNQSAHLAAIGDFEGALERARRALAIRERLMETKADVLAPELAVSLASVARMLAFRGDHSEAREKARTALQLRERLAERNPDRFEGDLAESLSDYSDRLAEHGECENALALSLRALEVSERLAQTNPGRFERDLATVLRSHSWRLEECGEYTGALSAASRAVEIVERLSDERPIRYVGDLAHALTAHAEVLADLGQYDEAVLSAERAVGAARENALINPKAFVADVLGCELSERRVRWLSGVEVDVPAIVPIDEAPTPLQWQLRVLSVVGKWIAFVSEPRTATRDDIARDFMRATADLDAVQAHLVEPHRHCVALWCFTAGQGTASTDFDLESWKAEWRRFVTTRSMSIPQWMLDTAMRLEMRWPDVI